MTRTADSPARTALGHRAVPVSLVILAYLVALAGRFTLDRAGLDDYAYLDVAVLGGVVVSVPVLLWWLDPRWTPSGQRPEATLVAVLVLIGYLAVTAVWAAPGARLGELLGPLGVLAVLILAVGALLGPDPEAGRRVLLWSVLASGVLYALAGVLIGDTDVQGRTTAFGGGANVFGRVVCLGAVAAIALAVIHRRRVLIAAVPLLAVAAVLSGSKGAFASTAAALLVLILVFPRRIIAGIAVPLVATGLAGVGIAAVVMGDRLGPMLDDRFLSVAAAGADFSGRPELLAESWRMFLDAPFAGAGLDAFWVRFGWTENLDYPHNIVAELGVTGGVIALALFGTVLVTWVSACRPPWNLSTSQVALILAAVLVLTSSLFSGDFYDTRFFWIFAVAAVVPARDWRVRRGGSASPATPRTDELETTA